MADRPKAIFTGKGIKIMNRKIAIASVQMYVHENDVDRNLKAMEQSVHFIARSYPFVEMILFSELALFGAPFPGWKRKAEAIPGPLSDRLSAVAKKYGKWLIPGSLYEKEGDRVYNTALVFGPDGEMKARYRKMFPWQPLEQTTPGQDFCVFDVPQVGRFGLCICYDMWFPEMCRTLAWMGAEVILHPTMTGSMDREQELIIARANAIFNQFYFVDINGTGFGGNGKSLIIDPHGRVLQSVGNEAMTLIEIIDLDEVRTAREYGVANVSQAFKQLAHFNPSFPVYEQGIANGEGFKEWAGGAKIRKKPPRKK